MVNALLFFIIPLGIAFWVSLFKKERYSYYTLLSFLFLLLFASLKNFFQFTSFSELVYFYTAGFKPPFSIAFALSKEGAFILSLVSFLAIVFYVFAKDYRKTYGAKFDSIFMIFIAGINGLTLTQDIFNLFIFNEIVAISLLGIVFSKNTETAWASSFRYMVVSSVLTGIFLIAITYIYNVVGSLYIKDIIVAMSPYDFKLLVTIPLIFLLTLVVVELKMFPFNGWALDLYQSSSPIVAMLISTILGLGSLVVLDKLAPIFTGYTTLLSWIFLLSFVLSNMIAIKQKSLTRLLGYSSIAYISLISFVIVNRVLFAKSFYWIVLGLIITHVLAKAILFFIAYYTKIDSLDAVSFIKKSSLLVFSFAVAVFALIGFPPLPSFFAKWDIVYLLSTQNSLHWIILILIGSLFEAVYLFKWFGNVIKDTTTDLLTLPFGNKFLIFILSLILIASTKILLGHISFPVSLSFITVFIVLGFFLIDRLMTVPFKNTLAIASLSYYAYILLPTLDSYRLLFAIIFIIGGIATLLPGYYYKGKREGFYPFALMMFFSLGALISARNFFDFFYNWELMTLGSYILILRGKKAKPHAYSYALFSMAGAYAMLLGIAVLNSSTFDISLSAISKLTENSLLVYLLLFFAFMTKTASVPFHIWLPGAHSEAESDVSPMVSAILLKAGLLGMVILMLQAGEQKIYGISVNYILSWIGVITALLGNMMASVQSDAKRLLAYSSVGQLGYALFALTFMTHLAWLAGFAMAINHFLFKAMLFWAIGGVYLRTHTKEMHRMGGLISRMPLSFITVLIAIIAVAGVPPLSGFAGKWLMFHAVIEKGWYLQGALAAFAGVVGFLYLFRLIHSIFLGQLKDEYRNVKEAPFWFILPQYLFIGAIMFFSVVPGYILRPIGNFLKVYFPDHALTWSNGTAVSFLGYWNPRLLMFVTVVIFLFVLLLLLITKRKSKKVKQFNIVYAAERPFRPETTHYAYNFFGHYRRALSFFFVPRVINFWNGIAGFYKMLADILRRIYTGNVQAYVVYIVLFIIIVFWVVL